MLCILTSRSGLHMQERRLVDHSPTGPTISDSLHLAGSSVECLAHAYRQMRDEVMIQMRHGEQEGMHLAEHRNSQCRRVVSHDNHRMLVFKQYDDGKGAGHPRQHECCTMLCKAHAGLTSIHEQSSSSCCCITGLGMDL